MVLTVAVVVVGAGVVQVEGFLVTVESPFSQTYLIVFVQTTSSHFPSVLIFTQSWLLFVLLGWLVSQLLYPKGVPSVQTKVS